MSVITEIDVKQVLKTKIGVDFRNYRILGACNPNGPVTLRIAGRIDKEPHRHSLLASSILCYKGQMKAWSWLRTMLPVLAIVGLILGPVIASANGPAMAAAPAMSAMAAEHAMADGMPCCPPKQPAMPDCQKDCPLMAICMAKCFADTPTLATFSRSVSGDGDLIALTAERFPASQVSTPPARPPRS